jgi:hypothetical protein
LEPAAATTELVDEVDAVRNTVFVFVRVDLTVTVSSSVEVVAVVRAPAGVEDDSVVAGLTRLEFFAVLVLVTVKVSVVLTVVVTMLVDEPLPIL